MPALPDPTRAEPIPAAALDEIAALLRAGDLFRYHAPADTPSPASRLEAEFAELMGSRFALAVSSCSAALFLTLRALGFEPGARVVIPAFTFAAVPSAVVHAGLTPLLVECGPDFRMCMDDLAAKLAQGASAVLVSHMRGHTSDMDAIMALAEAAGVPVIEDAAHSLGTVWRGRRIGTIGVAGCFSFQSYKLVNGGEGGMLITDDAELFARAVIMSGAYEHNWQKHAQVAQAAARWQNRLPLYNMRLSNLAAAAIRAQLGEIPRRVAQGRANHDLLADMLNAHPHFSVPAPLPGEERAPDSIQFLLEGMGEAEIRAFVALCGKAGVPVSCFGLAEDNARLFWNWQFLDPLPELPRTRAWLMRACDLRLPAHLPADGVRAMGKALIAAAERAVAGASAPALG